MGTGSFSVALKDKMLGVQAESVAETFPGLGSKGSKQNRNCGVMWRLMQKKNQLIGGYEKHICVRFAEICLTGIWKAKEVETVYSENKGKALEGREDLPDRI